MTPVKAPAPLCADAVPGQEAAATNANAAKDDFGMLTLLHSLGDQLATESVAVDGRAPYLEGPQFLARIEHRTRCTQTVALPGGCSFLRLP
jgi:hypothetical protein